MRSVISAILCAASVFTLSADVACAIDGIDAAPLVNPWHQQNAGMVRPYIVQAASSHAARREVERVGATPGRELGIINAVAAELTSSQLVRLNARGDARAYPDRSVNSESLSLTSVLSPVTSTVNPLLQSTLNVESVAEPLVDGGPLNVAPSLYVTAYPVQVGATSLQQEGINGKGVTIAVLDTANLDRRCAELFQPHSRQHRHRRRWLATGDVRSLWTRHPCGIDSSRRRGHRVGYVIRHSTCCEFGDRARLRRPGRGFL